MSVALRRRERYLQNQTLSHPIGYENLAPE